MDVRRLQRISHGHQLGGYNNYTLEVVDQMGTDSFTADSGVLLAKTKDSRSPNKWTVDANPQDIDTVDYTWPMAAGEAHPR